MGEKNGFTLWDDELEREFYSLEEIEASNARIREIAKDIGRGGSIKMKTKYKNCELNATREQSLGGEIFIYYSAYDLANGFEVISAFGDYQTCREAIQGMKEDIDNYRENPGAWNDDEGVWI